MRPADRAFLLLAAGICAFGLCFVDAARLRAAAGADEAERTRLVAQLRLTDLALFTEARYTRHPSQADLHSAFQDHPLALEHFPTGSLIPPPAGLLKVMPPGNPEAVSPADGADATAAGDEGGAK
ncbi:hypothetical protein [Sulfuritalea sp.]|uniref:hypothetical protein n=1 Tax=Sulfuritalea sp. TaxID=2480090 RepID=UPI00286EA117|nr:hypothetical protein [Sulfuritalea sp.]